MGLPPLQPLLNSVAQSISCCTLSVIGFFVAIPTAPSADPADTNAQHAVYYSIVSFISYIIKTSFVPPHIPWFLGPGNIAFPRGLLYVAQLSPFSGG